MAKGERDVAKERHWREVLKRQQSSGLNVRAYCQREQIAESAFHFWRRTIRERDDRAKPASPVPQFVPAVISSSIASEAFTLELAGGHLLRMPGISVERLADLIAALAACPFPGRQCLGMTSDYYSDGIGSALSSRPPPLPESPELSQYRKLVGN